MAFSGALTLTDLNDFISPSQACIKPVEQLNTKPQEEKVGGAKTEIMIDSSGSYYEVSKGSLGHDAAGSETSSAKVPAQKLEQAQISLNDCLACSGCITSAESILVTLQSHIEVFNFIESNRSAAPKSRKVLVLSIAPQSLASLAASLSASASASASSSSSGAAVTPITPRQVLWRVTSFCESVLGISHVFDTTFARHIAIQEHIREFEERKAVDQLGGAAAHGQLPMLASACPGWICYAEKAHSEMLPFISRTKSPQQVMGTVVKEWMAKRWGKTPRGVYHVSVMPCYDKKLEASRQDFYNDVYSTRDVDCVITTGELELMMKERDWDLSKPVPNELEDAFPLPPLSSPSSSGSGSATSTDICFPELIQHPGSSSGSYLQSIINHLIQTSPVPLVLSSKVIRNADYEEFTLAERPVGGGTGKVVFKGAKCYGFRNLQNVVRKVGRERGVRVGGGAAGKLAGSRAVGKRVVGRKAGAGAEDRQYDYVEVMACPGGCVNGGGQLKPVQLAPSSAPEPRETFKMPIPNPALDSAQKSRTEKLGNTDEEGYARNWEDSGVTMTTPPPVGTVDAPGGLMMQSAKWGDKDWTRKVEDAYWLTGTQEHEGRDVDVDMDDGSPDRNTTTTTDVLKQQQQADGIGVGDMNGMVGSDGASSHDLAPPATLPVGLPERQLTLGGEGVDATYGRRELGGGKGLNGSVTGAEKLLPLTRDRTIHPQSQSSGQADSGHLDLKMRCSDQLAARIVREMCFGRALDGDPDDATAQTEAEKSRHRFFRTVYHAVESEVVGLAVKW